MNIIVTVALWLRSGPRMRVQLRRVQHPTDRLVIEVANVGRMALRVKELGLEDRITGGTPSSSTSYISMPVAPTDGKPEQRILEHTDLPIVAEVPMERVVTRWFGGKNLTLVAWAKDGNDHKKTSRSLTFKTPPTTVLAATQSQHGLKLIRARYGAADKYLDMKAILERHVQNDRLSVIVSNDLAGEDPLYNVGKALEVEYSYDGQTSTKVVLEGSELVLP